MDQLSRTRMLLGDEAMRRLAAAKVAVFGLGGVGGHTAEALARSGVGELHLFDGDCVSLSNLNRQIVATRDVLGQPKVEVMTARIRNIDPEVKLVARQLFYLPENAGEVDLSQYSYVIDAVDTVAAKLELARRCERLNVPLICALGAGNKLDPTRLRVADIYETSVDPLARVMRHELRKRGVMKLKVVYSTESPRVPQGAVTDEASTKRAVPGSVAFVPSVMGLIMAGVVVRELAGVGDGDM